MTSERQTNTGILHAGKGPMTFHDKVIGQAFGAEPAPRERRESRTDQPRAHVAILTVLPEETRAVVAILQALTDYRTRRLGNDQGPQSHEATLDTPNGTVKVVAVQTLTRGPESAVSTFDAIVSAYAPRIVLLVGIAGGIGDRVGIGDVVISDQVILYDARRESAEQVTRRGQAQELAAALGHRLNEFFAATGTVATSGTGGQYRIHRGPIGSGNAVITDRDSEIRAWLRTFNEKVLAVETEAAGVARAFHERTAAGPAPVGWLTIRGISDTADSEKGHAHHEMASAHAAQVMLMLLPHLRFDG